MLLHVRGICYYYFPLLLAVHFFPCGLAKSIDSGGPTVMYKQESQILVVDGPLFLAFV